MHTNIKAIYCFYDCSNESSPIVSQQLQVVALTEIPCTTRLRHLQGQCQHVCFDATFWFNVFLFVSVCLSINVIPFLLLCPDLFKTPGPGTYRNEKVHPQGEKHAPAYSMGSRTRYRKRKSHCVVQHRWAQTVPASVNLKTAACSTQCCSGSARLHT